MYRVFTDFYRFKLAITLNETFYVRLVFDFLFFGCISLNGRVWLDLNGINSKCLCVYGFEWILIGDMLYFTGSSSRKDVRAAEFRADESGAVARGRGRARRRGAARHVPPVDVRRLRLGAARADAASDQALHRPDGARRRRVLLPAHARRVRQLRLHQPLGAAFPFRSIRFRSIKKK